MSTFEEQLQAASQRYQTNTPEREQRVRLLRDNKPFQADSRQRVYRWFQRRGFDQETAERAIKTGAVPTEVRETLAAPAEGLGLERVLGATDFLGVAFLENALRVARTVCRVSIGGRTGSPSGYGTGFLVSPRLLMTNNHVLSSAAQARDSVAEFDYYVRADGAPASVRVFSLEPQTFFLTDPMLDFTLVAVAAVGADGVRLASYSWNQLIPEEGKAIVGQWVNIIQHPNGEPKQLVLRNNEIVDLPGDFLLYVADTSPGSSGSPVFNDRWEVVALHHSGVPARDRYPDGRILDVNGKIWRPEQGEHRIQWKANEGARVSKIVAFVRTAQMDSAKRALFDASLQAPTSRPPVANTDREVNPGAAPGQVLFSMQPDGTAHWTVPLQFSVRIGGGALAASHPAVDRAAIIQTSVQPSIDTSAAVADLNDENTLLDAAKHAFAGRPDVLDVRLGYKFSNGWITNERAIVVKVVEKKSLGALRREGIAALPSVFRGHPLQLSGPTIYDLIRSRQPNSVEALGEIAELRTEEITYQAPPGGDLQAVDDTMSVQFNVSPDAGWPKLKDFLAGTRTTLVVGMYDFGAEHIVKALEAISHKSGFKELILVMQRGESLGTGTKKFDLTDQEVVDRLRAAFKKKLKFGWIRIGVKNGWVASSYHIKVAVRDRKSLWLSSGNWQSSNQPEVFLAAKNSKDYSFLKNYNREWHAIVAHEGLAKTFEKYLRHDYENGTAERFEERLSALPTLDLPLIETFRGPANPTYQYFPELILTNQRLKVLPLLTPDNYFDALIKLVRGARKEILIQNQTFNAPKESHEKLTELMTLLVDKQQRMPVRIVFRLLHAATARENLENLKEAGFDADHIKVQEGLHTKGVIVDGQKVLIGSQNISEQGISINRDASLLIDDSRVAKYFKQIFEHDWNNLAKQDVGSDYSPQEVGTDGVPEERFVKLTPKEYLELL